MFVTYPWFEKLVNFLVNYSVVSITSSGLAKSTLSIYSWGDCSLDKYGIAYSDVWLVT